jgi:hypothetical protein
MGSCLAVQPLPVGRIGHGDGDDLAEPRVLRPVDRERCLGGAAQCGLDIGDEDRGAGGDDGVVADGDRAPSAKGVLHLGATSCSVTDNADAILLREALQLVERGLAEAIAALETFARRFAGTPCLAFTHFQPAQPTTVGIEGDEGELGRAVVVGDPQPAPTGLVGGGLSQVSAGDDHGGPRPQLGSAQVQLG